MTQGEQGKATYTPTLIATVNVRALPIGPLEAFVLSRVDGQATDAGIALATGLAVAEVEATLSRLATLGAVNYRDPRPSGTNPTPPTQAGELSGMHERIRDPAIIDASPHPFVDRTELDEPADLDLDRKRLILETYKALPDLSHYEVLRVSPSADKKAIKAAYFEVVGLFHPDKYFGKSLGSFKLKLEKIFTRVTEAHDTLSRQSRRAEYDSYLASQRATRALDNVVDEKSARATLEDIRREIERKALAGGSGERPSAPAGAAPPLPETGLVRDGMTGPPEPRRPSSNDPGRDRGHPVPIEFRQAAPATAEERRRALARKLGASVPPPAQRGISSSPPPAQGPSAQEVATESLRRRYEARLTQARDEQVGRYMKQAEQAMTSRNLTAAANALRIAVSLAPENKSLGEEYERIERLASAALSDQYLEQARYDERRGHYAEAAQAYERVLRGRPSPHIYNRAAHCLLEARGDAKRAGDLARKAVELAPAETAYRITLARVYAMAGMDQSALGELERARAQDPSDDTIKDWIKRVKRGEI